MKVILVNGSPHEKGCTYTALTEVQKTLEKNEIETEIFCNEQHANRNISILEYGTWKQIRRRIKR